MKEIALELIKTGKERLKYPIISIYIIVLILWNWDVLSVYVFSIKPIEERIKFIENNYSNNWERVMFPFIKAILLAIVIPLLMWGLEYILHKINGGRRLIKNDNNKAIRNEKLEAAQNEFHINEARTGTKTIQEWEDKVSSLESRLTMQLENNNKNILDLQNIRETHTEEIIILNNRLSNFEDELMQKATNASFALIANFEKKKEFNNQTMLHLMHAFEILLQSSPLQQHFGNKIVAYPLISPKMLDEIFDNMKTLDLILFKNDIRELSLLGKLVYIKLSEMFIP